MLNEKVVAVRTDVDKRCGGGGGRGSGKGEAPQAPPYPHGPMAP